MCSVYIMCHDEVRDGKVYVRCVQVCVRECVEKGEVGKASCLA